ncbi:MAG: L-threonylcarbamoyladenylate synthase [Vicinamibacterales bacterium]
MSARPKVFAVDRARPDSTVIAEAASVIRAGGLVVFPTETVYGLGAHALDADAVARIFLAKERPATDPFIVHVACAADVPSIARGVCEPTADLMARFWPGPLTLILFKQPSVPDAVTSGRNTVGVRVPAHPVAQALLRAAGVPIAAPSANRFSRPSPTRVAHVLADLDGRVDIVLDAGPTDIGIESTVLDLTVSPPVVRRHGGVTFETLRALLPDVDTSDRYSVGAGAETAPGQLLRHYAPRARLTLYEGDADAVVAQLAQDARAAAASGRAVGVLAPIEDLMALAPHIAAQAARGRVATAALGSRRDPALAARELFDALRRLDAVGVDEILAATVDGAEIGRAIRDRLVRAAEGRVRRV